jgi:hypothetical protein
MTLIATAISAHGIVQAANPRLTSYPDKFVPGPRVFKLTFLNATLAVTGGYEVAGTPLDRWIVATIDQYKRTADPPSLRGFVEHLRQSLTPQPAPIHRRVIHVAGYVRGRTRTHPEVYYLRNIRGRAPDGSYGRPGREYIVDEHFWTFDYLRKDTKMTLREGGARMYLDGFPRNRIAYMVLHQRLHEFYRQIWQTSTRFRSPRSIEDIRALVELDMRATETFLGPRIQHLRMPSPLDIELIPAPANSAKL